VSRPNPAVGAILVKDGVVVGRGRTQPPGSHHAEKMALIDAGERARGADMYVTLEPCCHFGRTPPCTDAIIAAGVARVFVSVIDENPRVNGGGIEKLREAGIEVELGLFAEQATELYRGFFYHMRTGLPWVDVKIAQSLDGFIAGVLRERTQITGAVTGEWVHRLRARVDAIAVGGGTALHDDPLLTVRGVVGNNPMRIVVCSRTELPVNLKLFHDQAAPTMVYSRLPQSALSGCEHVQLETWSAPEFAEAWLGLLARLGAQGFHRVLFEAGAKMAKLLLEDPRFFNRLLLLTAPKLLGEGLPWERELVPTWKDGLHLSRFELVDCDFLTEFTCSQESFKR